MSSYHFSISWSRIFPNGTGQPNPKGLDYYQRVIDELLADNITPCIDLFVWDLPHALPGGWRSRDTAKAFAEYAGYVTKRISDRVHQFFTVNECVSFADVSRAAVVPPIPDVTLVPIELLPPGCGRRTRSREY